MSSLAAASAAAAASRSAQKTGSGLGDCVAVTWHVVYANQYTLPTALLPHMEIRIRKSSSRSPRSFSWIGGQALHRRRRGAPGKFCADQPKFSLWKKVFPT